MALSPEQVRAWLVESCEAQGVPVTVDDPATLRDVVVLLTGRAGDRSASRPGTPAARS